MAIIVSYGGGVNSTAMLVFMVSQAMTPKAIVFADTGGEKPETYQYIDNFSIWLQARGFPPITIVKYKTKEGVEITLEDDVMNNKTIPSIAFGWKSCSHKFKILPVDRFIKANCNDDLVHLYIGFDYGEKQRMKENPEKFRINIYPLITLEWNRERCKEEIVKAGLPLPPKSSYYFCPNMKKGEILALSDDLKERVKSIEANATNLIELKGLGRHYAWTDLINADDKQHKLFDDLDMYAPSCECID